MRVRILSWNVAGLVSMEPWVKYHYGSLKSLFERYEADIVCLQETKLTPERVSPSQADFLHAEGWDSYHCIGTNGGYCGVATYVRRGLTTSPVRAAYTNVKHYLETEAGLSEEGRLLVTDHGCFVLFNVYAPNAGDPPERPRLPVKLAFLDALLEKMEEVRSDGRAVVLVGDLNVVADAKADSHPGLRCPWSAEELGWFSRVQSWYVDSFRHLHPDQTDAYTCWDQMKDNRGRNWGVRIDYILLSRDRLLPCLRSASVLDTPHRMSDHAAVEAVLELDDDDQPPLSPSQQPPAPAVTTGAAGYMAEISGAKLFKRTVPDSQRTLKTFFAHKLATPTASAGGTAAAAQGGGEGPAEDDGSRGTKRPLPTDTRDGGTAGGAEQPGGGQGSSKAASPRPVKQAEDGSPNSTAAPTRSTPPPQADAQPPRPLAGSSAIKSSGGRGKGATGSRKKQQQHGQAAKGSSTSGGGGGGLLRYFSKPAEQQGKKAPE